MERLKEKKVSDIMVPIYDYPTASSEATLRNALRVLAELWYPQDNRPRSGRNRIIIIEDNQPAGTFGVSELLEAIEPQYSKGFTFVGMKIPSALSFPIFWEGLFTERCQEVANRKVGDYMTPFEFFVDMDAPLLRASYTMAKNKTDSVAVRNNGHLVGIVRSYDIFREISDLVTSGDIYYGTGTDGR